MLRSTRPLLALCVCAVALLVPAAAHAQQPAVAIDGSPLNVYAAADGGIQTNVDGFASSEWYPFSDGASPSQVGNAGFGLILDPENTQGGTQTFGKLIGALPAPDSGPTLAAGNPATITTTWTLLDPSAGSPRVRLTEVLAYTNGQRQFNSTFTVQNVSSSPLSFRANVAGDLAIRGSDSGIGFLSNGPPRFMGGLNQDVGAAGGFVEQTPWTRYESNSLGTIYGAVSDASPTGGFDNSLSTQSSDNAAGVQWDNHYAAADALQPNASAQYQVAWRFIDTLGLSPTSAVELTGNQHTVTVHAGDVNGNAAGNKKIGYAIQGANNITGTVTTGSDGTATISWIGGAPGTDTLTAFVDTNANGSRDTNEAQATATVEWQGVQAPQIGVSADVRPVKGTVKVKLPPGTSFGKASKLGLTGAAAGFVKLKAATQIPMGSTLDTSHGTVNLLASASKNAAVGKFQSGNFSGGIFKTSQSRKNPLTQLSMTGGGLNRCKAPVPHGGSAARKRGRRLFSSVHGRFRTRGRNSSATVRGTKWTMIDTCTGTLTAVSKGSVVVHDFTLRKNKTVKAGHRYFAKAPKPKRHHKKK